MEKKVLDLIDKLNIPKKETFLILAVSGGADSMAMAHFMLTRFPQYRYGIAHMNHGLRAEADEEESFVRAFAERYGVSFFCEKADISALAKERKQGIEETAREERYRFLYSLGADFVVTAHHKNDQAETVLLHLLRGCGINGLRGMEPCSGKLLRPMLCVAKAEILAYCEKHGLAYKNDLSNDDTVFTRNKIRKELIPKMEEINPDVTDALYRLSESVAADDLYLEKVAKRCYEECCGEEDGYLVLDLSKVLSEGHAIARRAVRLCCEHFRVNLDFEHTERILALSNGKGMPLGKELWVYRDGNCLYFGSRRIPVGWDDEVALLKNASIETERFLVKTAVVTASPKGDASSLGVFDTALVGDAELKLRTRRNGDYVILPNGKRKKLSDFLIDEKVPSYKRDSLLLLGMDDRILWVVGYRVFAPKGEENLIVEISVKS